MMAANSAGNVLINNSLWMGSETTFFLTGFQGKKLPLPAGSSPELRLLAEKDLWIATPPFCQLTSQNARQN